jgi:hypothetical protein
LIIHEAPELAVRVMQYKDQVKPHLPSACPVKGLSHSGRAAPLLRAAAVLMKHLY